jgi:hypothetical protein
MLLYFSIYIEELNLELPGFQYTYRTQTEPMICCLCSNQYTYDQLKEFNIENINMDPEDCNCPICFKVMNDVRIPMQIETCGHIFCKPCAGTITERKTIVGESMQRIGWQKTIFCNNYYLLGPPILCV